MEIFFVICLGLGYIGGVVISVYLVSKFFKSRSINNIIYYFTLGSLLAGAFPAIFLGTVIGGNLGGAWAAYITESLGYGSVGAPVGIAIGVFIVIPIVMVICAYAGYFISFNFYKILNNAKNT